MRVSAATKNRYPSVLSSAVNSSLPPCRRRLITDLQLRRCRWRAAGRERGEHMHA